jgi:Aminoglycoside adenylyltransferase, C-terminal domain/Nucleotidyltransferase domain
VSEREQRHELRGATSFPELDDLLTRFVRCVRSTLGTRVVGVYLTGSFALRGGDAASDCDFLVVTNGPVPGRQEEALRELHWQIPTWASYWAHNLEGSYAPKTDLETLSTLGRPWLYVNRGRRELESSSHCNTADVRWVLRERPLILDGADPRAFACDVPAIALQRQMRPQIESFLDQLLSWTTFDISWTQRYAVEAISRMLYTLERGEVISKQDALAWAKEALPEWRELIDQVRRDRFVQWNDPPPPGSVERTLAFIEYVQQRVRTKSASPSQVTDS